VQTKWRLSSLSHKVGAAFAALGFAMAVAILSISWYINTHGLRHDLSIVALVLCPPSFGLMAADNAGPIMQVFLALLVAIENAVLYGLIGLAIGKLLLGSTR
jgi:hypothetical protein